MNKQEGRKLGGQRGGKVIADRWKEKEKEYLLSPNYCSECKCALVWKNRNNKFCSSSCAASHNNKRRQSCTNQFKTKLAKCNCGNDVEINIRSDPKRVTCNECRYIKLVEKRRCKCCGRLSGCDKRICETQLIPTLLRLGFNSECIGNINYLKEFDRIKNIVSDLYYVENLSSIAIADIYGFNHDFADRMRRLGIKLRSFSEALRMSLIEGRSKINYSATKYKTGWHTTWSGTKIFYRSSYELEYALQLDEQKIKYDVEQLRVEYWDSQAFKYRIAIPDFYLSESNTIVEIKSDWTYNEQNMIDRVQKFKELGYNFKLILEKKEIEMLP